MKLQVNDKRITARKIPTNVDILSEKSEEVVGSPAQYQVPYSHKGLLGDTDEIL